MTEPTPEPPVELGILSLTKKALNTDSEDASFDAELIMFINSALADLQQLGPGPEEGAEIVDDTTKWSDILGTEKRYNSVKAYIYMLVRLKFDPPGDYFLVKAMEDEILKAEVRINTAFEAITFPTPVLVPDDDEILGEML
jgi:hypothetical protein